MTTAFFQISDNSIGARGVPWIQSVNEGLQDSSPCHVCGVAGQDPVGELRVTMDPKKGSQWPDVLGCGAYPLLVVSERVLEAWTKEGVGTFPAQRVMIGLPLPKRIADVEPPPYFWVDGERMRGAELDFDKSGFVGVQFCPGCGIRSEDDSATYRKQHARVWPYTFVPGSWNGANLFTTDLSPAAFFCTAAVVECAAKHGHANFRFVPVEQGTNPESKGIAYLKRSRRN